MEEYAYLLSEIIVMITFYLFCANRVERSTFFSRRRIFSFSLIYGGILVVDILGARLGLYAFNYSLTTRLGSTLLPLEEHLAIVFLAVASYFMLMLFADE